jgi:hypothetical protein
MSYLGDLAVALDGVLDTGGLHEEGVVLRHHPAPVNTMA